MSKKNVNLLSELHLSFVENPDHLFGREDLIEYIKNESTKENFEKYLGIFGMSTVGKTSLLSTLHSFVPYPVLYITRIIRTMFNQHF